MEKLTITDSIHGQPCLEIHNPSAQLRLMVHRILSANHIDDPDYHACHPSSPFLQCDEKDYMLIEFWGPKAEDFVSYLQERLVDPTNVLR